MSQQEPLSNNSSARPSAGGPGRKRPVSERRIQANRRNALRSTGPTTERGKRIIARNAIKHGVFAREVVITAGDGKEDLSEFHDIVEKLCKQYEPVGVVEESLVQTIATCWWRKARVLRAENGEIRRRLDTSAVDRALRNSDSCNLDLALTAMDLSLFSPENQADHKLSSMDRWSAMQSVQTGLRGHYSGLSYLTAQLESARSEIVDKGHLSETLRRKITLTFGFWGCLLAFTCACAGEGNKEGQSPTGFSHKQADNEYPSVIALIDDRLKRMRTFMEYATEREELVGDAEARSFSLPSTDATDKLLRYEAHLDRQLYRAMDQLERLQRQGNGETVPPPLNINLERRR